MIKLPNTLSFRLTCWYAGAFAFFLVFALVLSYFALGTILEDDIDEDLQEDIIEFQQLFSGLGLSAVIQEIELETSEDNSEGVFFKIVSLDGQQVHSSDLNSWQGLIINQASLDLVGFDAEEMPLETQTFESREYPARVIYGALSAQQILVVGESLEDTVELLELILMIFALLMFLVIPVAGYIGWRISQKAVRAISEVSNAALDIHSGQFDRRIDTQAYGEEITTLISTFNAMAKRIQKLISEMREMTDNIAHDLRSPIARIRVISETVLAESKNPNQVESATKETITECDRLIKLINTTLDVAEAEADLIPQSTERVSLSEIAEEMCDLYQPLAEKKQIKLHCHIQASVYLDGRRQDLQRVFVNLIDNALKYTSALGEVHLRLNLIKKVIVLQIEDTGIGISEQDKPHVFDRFYRCDESRSEEGCGLGLSFVAAVVKTHKGTIKLESVLAEGTCVTMQFEAPTYFT